MKKGSKTKLRITANLMYKAISSITFIVIIAMAGYIGVKYTIPADLLPSPTISEYVSVTDTPSASVTPCLSKAPVPTLSTTSHPSVGTTLTPNDITTPTPTPSMTLHPSVGTISTPNDTLTPAPTPSMTLHPSVSTTSTPNDTLTPAPTPSIISRPSVAPSVVTTPTTSPTTAPSPSVLPFHEPEIHFISSNGDATLITSGNESVLIDTGKDFHDAYNYLCELGITHLDCLILTSQQTCHSGGLTQIIGNIDIDRIILPEIDEKYSIPGIARCLQNYNGTVDYINLSDVGRKYTFSCGQFELLTPLIIDIPERLREYSISVRFTYGMTSFLIMSDITTENESALLSSGKNIKSDIIKIAGHAKNGNTSRLFLETVSPRFAVITPIYDVMGEPRDETDLTIAMLDDLGIEYHDTSLSSIIFVSDGKETTIKSIVLR